MDSGTSLIEQAARSAADADGLLPPPKDANAEAAAALTSFSDGAKKPASEEGDGMAALDKEESVIAGATSKPAATTAGSAAHHAILAGGVKASFIPSTVAARKPPAPPPPPAKAPTSMAPTLASSKKKGPPLRRGKWTHEEEAYANRLIQEFKAGLLPLTDGTTLRTFLSKLLNCDPMRISKKFVGTNCIGKQVFRRRTADINRLTPDQIAQSRAELSE